MRESDIRSRVVPSRVKDSVSVANGLRLLDAIAKALGPQALSGLGRALANGIELQSLFSNSASK